MKNILLPIGLSEEKTTLNKLQYSVDLARHTRSKLYVIDSFKRPPRTGSLPSVTQTLKDLSISRINDLIGRIDVKDVDLVPIAVEGDVLEAIPEFNLKYNIDLLILNAENPDLKNTTYLNESTGSILKNTEIPVLILPQDYQFKSIKKILMVIKSGRIKKSNVLKPIEDILTTFEADLKLLQIKTSDFVEEDAAIDSKLNKLTDAFLSSENATLFQGVLEHLNQNQPDLLCVIRRSRGFFETLWEENKVLKKDFESRIPLLVLKGAN